MENKCTCADSKDNVQFVDSDCPIPSGVDYQNPETWPTIKVYGTDFRTECAIMAQALTRLKLWDSLKAPPGPSGFMFGSGDWERVLKDKEVMKCGHSGATEAVCLQIMRQIVIQGWNSVF